MQTINQRFERRKAISEQCQDHSSATKKYFYNTKNCTNRIETLVAWWWLISCLNKIMQYITAIQVSTTAKVWQEPQHRWVLVQCDQCVGLTLYKHWVRRCIQCKNLCHEEAVSRRLISGLTRRRPTTSSNMWRAGSAADDGRCRRIIGVCPRTVAGYRRQRRRLDQTAAGGCRLGTPTGLTL